MMNAETGQRGYLLTKNLAYLEPYHKGMFQSKESFKKLGVLVSDNAEQTHRLEEIKTQMNLKLAELKKTIQLAESGQKEKALIIVQQNEGKHYMDKIRGLTKDFISEEQKLLEIRKGDFKASRTRLSSFILGEMGLILVLFIFIFTFLSRNLFYPLSRLLRGLKSNGVETYAKAICRRSSKRRA